VKLNVKNVAIVVLLLKRMPNLHCPPLRHPRRSPHLRPPLLLLPLHLSLHPSLLLPML
jgi:hypothetical protein